MDLLELLSGIGTVLDTPGAFVRTGLSGRNPFPGIFNPDERASGRDMLEAWGLLDDNQEGLDWGDVGGFAAELLTDPTNLLGLAGALQARKLSSLANDLRQKATYNNFKAVYGDLLKEGNRRPGVRMGDIETLSDSEVYDDVAESIAKIFGLSRKDEAINAGAADILDNAGRIGYGYSGDPLTRGFVQPLRPDMVFINTSLADNVPTSMATAAHELIHSSALTGAPQYDDMLDAASQDLLNNIDLRAFPPTNNGALRRMHYLSNGTSPIEEGIATAFGNAIARGASRGNRFPLADAAHTPYRTEATGDLANLLSEHLRGYMHPSSMRDLRRAKTLQNSMPQFGGRFDNSDILGELDRAYDTAMADGGIREANDLKRMLTAGTSPEAIRSYVEPLAMRDMAKPYMEIAMGEDIPDRSLGLLQWLGLKPHTRVPPPNFLPPKGGGLGDFMLVGLAGHNALARNHGEY